MSETILRQLAMLRRVPRAPRAVTTAVLVEKLAEEGFIVSIRSVQRDLEMLSALFPLRCDQRAKPYGWSWEKDALQELPGMDTATALTFTLAARFLGPLMPRSSLRYLEPHFQRAEAILTEMRSGGFAAWPAKVRALAPRAAAAAGRGGPGGPRCGLRGAPHRAALPLRLPPQGRDRSGTTTR